MDNPANDLTHEDPVSYLLEYIDTDPQPTFVLELPEPDSRLPHRLPTLKHANPALRSLSALHKRVVNGSKQSADLSVLLDRLVDERNTAQSPGARSPAVFCNLRWAVTIIGRRWAVVVSAENHAVHIKSNVNLEDTPPPVCNGTSTKAAGSADKPSVADARPDQDISKSFMVGELASGGHLGKPQYLEWVRQYDWASSPLGPVPTWSPELRQAFELALAHPDPMCIWYGPQYTLIYNHPHSEMTGDKHPRAFARPMEENWKEHWPIYKKVFEQVKQTGQAIKQENNVRHFRRGDYFEEEYVTVNILPIVAADRSVSGISVHAQITTRQVLSERRIQSLVDLNDVMANSQNLYTLWRAVLGSLKKAASDIQFAAIYSIDLRQQRGSNVPVDFTLEAMVGPEGVRNASSLCKPGTDMNAVVLKAFQDGEIRSLRVSDGTLTESMLSEYESYGVNLSCREAMVQPLRCDVEEHIAAVLVIAVNPLRRLRADYLSFVHLLSNQIESAITTIRGIEKEKRLAHFHALSEAEKRFRVFAERAPIGVHFLDCDGRLIWGNNAFEDLVGARIADLQKPMAWTDLIHPSCLQEMEVVWQKLIDEGGTHNYEVQFKKPWSPHTADGTEALDRTYCVGTAYPDVSEDGELKGIIACITDCSSAKWVEKLQAKKLAEALEMKRQQESFLDITSHEMRNPLNSILHCASELLEQLGRDESLHPTSTAFQDCLEMATTIDYCANHQKRLVNDILTLSKLDSRLLQLFPAITDPIKLIDGVLGIFHSELRASAIQTELNIGDRYRQLGLDLVYLDPHRVTQIIINLVSNAIKFTKNGLKRFLKLTLDASLTEVGEKECEGDFKYVPSGIQYQDPTTQTEWGNGQTIFLSISIQDTGPGISKDEAGRLFGRFQQASPRTHTQYGGSGLGLFISRELAEMHGGRIGLSSQPGSGSMFKFFVKVRRGTTTPDSSKELIITPPLDAEHLLVPMPHVQQSRQMQARTNSAPATLIQIKDTVPKSSTPSQTVLVVEDNIINQRLLKKLVMKRGYEVLVANNGEEALAVISSSTRNTGLTTKTSETPGINLVLCDIEMPVMDGKTCVRRIRQLEREGLFEAGLPVIAVTGNARSEQVDEARQCGFNAVITKPYVTTELFQMIERYTKNDEG